MSLAIAESRIKLFKEEELLGSFGSHLSNYLCIPSQPFANCSPTGTVNSHCFYPPVSDGSYTFLVGKAVRVELLKNPEVVHSSGSEEKHEPQPLQTNLFKKKAAFLCLHRCQKKELKIRCWTKSILL